MMDKIFDTGWKYVRKSTPIETLYNVLSAIIYLIVAYVSAIMISEGWFLLIPFALIAIFCFGSTVCELGTETIGNVGDYKFDDE